MWHSKDSELVTLEPSRAILFCRHLDIWLQQLNENNADLISNNNIYRDMY